MTTGDNTPYPYRQPDAARRAATRAALDAFAAASGSSPTSDAVAVERLITALCHLVQSETNPTDVLATALRAWNENEQIKESKDYFDIGFQEAAVHMIASVLAVAVNDTTCDGPPRLVAAAFEMVFGCPVEMVIAGGQQDVADSSDATATGAGGDVAAQADRYAADADQCMCGPEDANCRGRALSLAFFAGWKAASPVSPGSGQ